MNEIDEFLQQLLIGNQKWDTTVAWQWHCWRLEGDTIRILRIRCVAWQTEVTSQFDEFISQANGYSRETSKSQNF